jgi:hypothetical protein
MYLWLLKLGYLIVPGNHEPGVETLSLFEENPLRGDEAGPWGDEPADDVHALLEDIARLQGLLIKPSPFVLKNVVHPR